MNNPIFTFLIIPVSVIVISSIIRYIRNKIYQPAYEDKVQKPGRLEQWIVKVFVILTGIAVFFAVLGFLAKEMEMALVFGGLALIFLVIIMVLKWAHDTSYYETDDYFILKTRDKEYQVYYENIVDWVPAFNEIAILDETRSNKKYIEVNIRMFKPEILLRKVADMAFAGKFNHLNERDTEDPNREIETINYLINHQYGYLVEDYVEQIENQNILPDD